MSVELLAVRHAPTDWNARRLLQGRADPPLSAAGRQAVATWRLPPGWAQAQCLASPLVRAIETAKILGFRPQVDARLIEMDWGDWEGRTLADLRATFGEDMAANEARGLDFRPPNGESPRDVQARLRPLLAEISRPTIAITHKGVVRALHALATGWTMRDKPQEKLRDGCAHVFAVGKGGALSPARLNVPLTAAP